MKCAWKWEGSFPSCTDNACLSKACGKDHDCLPMWNLNLALGPCQCLAAAAGDYFPSCPCLNIPWVHPYALNPLLLYHLCSMTVELAKSLMPRPFLLARGLQQASHTHGNLLQTLSFALHVTIHQLEGIFFLFRFCPSTMQQQEAAKHLSSSTFVILSHEVT